MHFRNLEGTTTGSFSVGHSRTSPRLVRDGTTKLSLREGGTSELAMLEINPILPHNVYSVSFTPSKYENVLICDATAGGITVTLPLASTVPGKNYHILKTDSGDNKVTVTPTSPNTIQNESEAELEVEGESIHIYSDGLDWWVL